MVFATSYPRIHFKLHLDYSWGSAGPRHFISAYPLHDQTTLRLFSGKGWCILPKREKKLQGTKAFNQRLTLSRIGNSSFPSVWMLNEQLVLEDV